jgi:serine/threonine protein kinase
VILGGDYDTSTDMWSFGCMVYELATGDFLFDPHSGENWDRDEGEFLILLKVDVDFCFCLFVI